MWSAAFAAIMAVSLDPLPGETGRPSRRQNPDEVPLSP